MSLVNNNVFWQSCCFFQIAGLTVLTSLLGYKHVSPALKLQKTLKESLEQPWLGSIQYSPAGGDREKRWENVKVWLWLLKMFIHHRPGTDISARISCQVCFGFCGLFPLPSLRSGWLRFRSWQVRAGLSWVPIGKRIVSISWRRELREPKISSMPSLPIRNSVPAVSDASMSGSNSGASWLASMERLDLGLLWMGSGWMTSPGGPWEASLHH